MFHIGWLYINFAPNKQSLVFARYPTRASPSTEYSLSLRFSFIVRDQGWGDITTSFWTRVLCFKLSHTRKDLDFNTCRTVIDLSFLIFLEDAVINVLRFLWWHAALASRFGVLCLHLLFFRQWVIVVQSSLRVATIKDSRSSFGEGRGKFVRRSVSDLSNQVQSVRMTTRHLIDASDDSMPLTSTGFQILLAEFRAYVQRLGQLQGDLIVVYITHLTAVVVRLGGWQSRRIAKRSSIFVNTDLNQKQPTKHETFRRGW